jgi:hypothetical protein
LLSRSPLANHDGSRLKPADPRASSRDAGRRVRPPAPRCHPRGARAARLDARAAGHASPIRRPRAHRRAVAGPAAVS